MNTDSDSLQERRDFLSGQHRSSTVALGHGSTSHVGVCTHVVRSLSPSSQTTTTLFPGLQCWMTSTSTSSHVQRSRHVSSMRQPSVPPRCVDGSRLRTFREGLVACGGVSFLPSHTHCLRSLRLLCTWSRLPAAFRRIVGSRRTSWWRWRPCWVGSCVHFPRRQQVRCVVRFRSMPRFFRLPSFACCFVLPPSLSFSLPPRTTDRSLSTSSSYSESDMVASAPNPRGNEPHNHSLTVSLPISLHHSVCRSLASCGSRRVCVRGRTRPWDSHGKERRAQMEVERR